MPVVRALLEALGEEKKPVMLTSSRGAMHSGTIVVPDVDVVTLCREDGRMVYVSRQHIESGFVVDL